MLLNTNNCQQETQICWNSAKSINMLCNRIDLCLLKLNQSKVENISSLVALCHWSVYCHAQLSVMDCIWKHLNTSYLVWLYLRPSVWSSRRAALHWLHIVKCLPSGQPPSLRSPLHCRSRQAWVWRPGLSGNVSCSGYPPPARSPFW